MAFICLFSIPPFIIDKKMFILYLQHTVTTRHTPLTPALVFSLSNFSTVTTPRFQRLYLSQDHILFVMIVSRSTSIIGGKTNPLRNHTQTRLYDIWLGRAATIILHTSISHPTTLDCVQYT